jgi:N-carbamoylputrescine amidase
MQKVKIGIIQQSCSENTTENMDKAVASIKKVSKSGAQIVCLQELFATQYFCDSEEYKNFELAETLDGNTITNLGKVAREEKIVLIAPFFEKKAKGVYYNSAAIINSEGDVIDIYRKNHIPDDPGFYEKFYFTPGDTGYKVCKTEYGKIAVLICWDQWFPEAARIVSLMGAEIIFYPTAIGWELDTSEDINQEQYQAWQTIQRAHAIANGVFTVAVNRVGRESITNFWGGSFISNPFGKVLYEAPNNEGTEHVEEIDLNKIEYYRRIWPFLRDRRIDTYNPILKRYIE